MKINIFKNGETLEEERINFNFRINILMLIFLIFLFLLFARLFQKQVLQHRDYLVKAESQHHISKEVPAHRGKIYFRGKNQNETYLAATNLCLYALSVVPRQVKNKEETARILAKYLDLKEKEIFDLINNDKPYIPPLKHKLSFALAEKISEENLAGVMLVPEEWRFYPEGNLGAQLLGYVNREGKGLYGIEGYFETELAGDSGKFFAEKDVFGRYISISGEKEALDGKDIVLTIDRSVEYQAEKLIKDAVQKYGAKSGEIVIADPATGKIIAMAVFPTFDPNKYTEAANRHGTSIFNNPAVNSVFEPGSVLKPIIMAAAVDAEKVTPASEGYFPAFVEIGKEKIWTAERVAYGRQNMTQVLETSNNVGMVYVQQKLGKKLLYKYLKDNFGFGRPTGINLFGETSAELSKPQVMREIDAATIAFGQGIAVTDIQLVSAFSALANGGKIMKPQIVEKIIETNTENKEPTVKEFKKEELRQAIKPSTASYLSEMLTSVVERGHGQKAKVAGYKIAGKTGTAQIPVKGGYSKLRTIQSFCGYAPADNPRFVMLVKLTEPKTSWSAYSAAPIFAEMAKYLFNYYQIPPTS